MVIENDSQVREPLSIVGEATPLINRMDRENFSSPSSAAERISTSPYPIVDFTGPIYPDEHKNVALSPTENSALHHDTAEAGNRESRPPSRPNQSDSLTSRADTPPARYEDPRRPQPQDAMPAIGVEQLIKEFGAGLKVEDKALLQKALNSVADGNTENLKTMIPLSPGANPAVFDAFKQALERQGFKVDSTEIAEYGMRNGTLTIQAPGSEKGLRLSYEHKGRAEKGEGTYKTESFEDHPGQPKTRVFSTDKNEIKQSEKEMKDGFANAAKCAEEKATALSNLDKELLQKPVMIDGKVSPESTQLAKGLAKAVIDGKMSDELAKQLNDAGEKEIKAAAQYLKDNLPGSPVNISTEFKHSGSPRGGWLKEVSFQSPVSPDGLTRVVELSNKGNFQAWTKDARNNLSVPEEGTQQAISAMQKSLIDSLNKKPVVSTLRPDHAR